MVPGSCCLEVKMPPVIPFHPLLPTLPQSEAKDEQVYYEHLPIIAAKLPIEESTTGFTLNIISWNIVLTQGESKTRQRKVIGAILKMIKTQDPSIIFLQGSWPELEQQLEDTLRERDWLIAKSDNGTPILWHNFLNRRTETSLIRGVENIVSPLGQQSSKILFDVAGSQIILWNICYTKPSGLLSFETQIKELVELARINKMQLVLAGDFGFPLYQPEKSTLVNSVRLLPNGKQGINWSDGIFYTMKYHFNQAVSNTLDPLDGNIYLDMASLAEPINASDFNESQQKELITPRLSLDLRSLFVGLQDHFAEEVAQYVNKGFVLRIATDANNKRYEAMCSVDSAATAVIAECASSGGCQIGVAETKGQPEYFVIFSTKLLITKIQRQQVEAFLKIYLALYMGSSKIFKEANFVRELKATSYSAAYEIISQQAGGLSQDNIMVKAWRLAQQQKHYTNCTPSNIELFKSIYWHTYVEKGVYFARSRFNTTLLPTSANDFNITDVDISSSPVDTRTGQIREALKTSLVLGI